MKSKDGEVHFRYFEVKEFSCVSFPVRTRATLFILGDSKGYFMMCKHW